MDLQDCHLLLITRALLCNEEAGKKGIIRVQWSGQALSLASCRTSEFYLSKPVVLHHFILTHSCIAVEAQVPHLNLFFNGYWLLES